MTRTMSAQTTLAMVHFTMPIPFRRTCLFCSRLVVATLLVLSQVALAAADSNTTNTAADAMANAMARMMESMGFKDIGSPGSAGGYGPMGSSGWPSAFAPWSGVPGQFGPSMPTSGRGVDVGWGNSVFEGVWEDNQGGLLIVQGGSYRLYSSCNGSVDGDIRVSSDRVGLTNWKESFTQTFEFALDQGRLALRNQSGQVFLYRRLVLGRGR
jgi:hypothetical protein